MRQPSTLRPTGPVRASQPLRAGVLKRLTACLEDRPSSPTGLSTGQALRGAGDGSTVPGNISVLNDRFNISTSEGGDSPVS